MIYCCGDKLSLPSWNRVKLDELDVNGNVAEFCDYVLINTIFCEAMWKKCLLGRNKTKEASRLKRLSISDPG